MCLFVLIDLLSLLLFVCFFRRSVYYAVEKVANNPSFTDPKERVGVPEHFGIYYAIGQYIPYCYIYYDL